MSGSFYLKCMGHPELHTPDGRVARMRGRKHLALLIFLAVERRAQYNRDELAHLLWPDVPMSEARHSLATGFSAIRRALGRGVLVGSRDTIRFRRESVALDLDRLEKGDLFATPARPDVEVAGFLQGFEVRGAPEFDHWRDRQQARWLPQIHGALLRLIDHARRTGASRSIGTLSDRLLELDPLSEAGIRARMEALAFGGDRISALRAFEEWRDRLGAELSAVPSPMVEQMARRLRRRGVERPVGDLVPLVPTDPWRDRPFVGRATEYRALYEAWESTVRHAPRHVLVEGESGIGKTTLVERFAMAAALEGAIVTRVQCYELEQAIPFAAIATLAAGLLDKPGVAACDPAALAEVARVVPRVRDRFPGLPPAQSHQGETARLHFAEGLLAMLEAVMEEHPVVLVVDDFHLADEVSLTVLHLLMRRMDAARMMVLLTLRAADTLASSGASRIRDGRDYLRLERVFLPPLTEAESMELLSALVPADAEPPSPSERHVLLEASRGFPMVLQLLVHDWHRNGTASLAISVRSMTGQITGHRIPEGTYQHILQRVLEDLDAPTRLVLHVATILGSRLNDLSLYALADLTVSQTMMGMGELTRRHILRDTPTGLDFVNELVRGQAYLQMPLAIRKAVHGSVADALLARLASGVAQVRGLETAWHLVRAGRPQEAAPHLLRGAREAILTGAPHEAELALSSALVEHLVLQGDARIDAALIHAEVLQELSLWGSSLDTLDGLAADIPLHFSQRRDLLRRIATRRLATDGDSPVTDRLEALLALADAGIDQSVRARAAVTAAQLVEELQVSGVHERLRYTLDLIAPQCTTPALRADLLMAHATLAYDTGEMLASTSYVREALQIMEDAGIASAAQVNLVSGLSALHCAMGDYETGEVHAREAFRLAQRLDNAYLAGKAATNASVAIGRQGRYAEQEHWGRNSLIQFTGPGQHTGHMRSALLVGEARAMLGYRDAIDSYHAIINKSPQDKSAWESRASLLNEADLYQMLGNRKRAMELGRAATQQGRAAIPSRGWAGKFARWLTLDGLDSRQHKPALDIVSRIVADRHRLDALDRLEVIACYLALAPGWSPESQQLSDEGRGLLAKMPPAIADRLDRLALLSYIGQAMTR